MSPFFSERAGKHGFLRRRAAQLETISVDVPETALEAYEAALSSTCASVGFFGGHNTGAWHVEGLKSVGGNEPQLAVA